MAWEYALIIGIVVGIILGIIVIRLSGGNAQQKALQEELDKTKAELEQYRSNITEHFQRSSVLLNNMVKEYSQLYNHFSQASVELTPDEGSSSNPFNFRIVDATPARIEQGSDNQPIESETISSPSLEQDANQPKDKVPPRDYSEGASGLLRTEPKE